MGRLPAYAALAGVTALSLCLTADLASAQSRPELLPFPGRTKAALYRPDSGPAPHVGIMVMHRTSNYLTHRACTELSRRGFLMLCMNSRFENNEPAVDFEKLPLDVKMGVEFLRKQPGITKVILFGHSGGGPIMALYQAVAEKGTAYCKGANKLMECGDDLANLPRADGIVFTDAHPSNAINLLRGINPSVANENNPPDAPPIAELDPFNPKNGFNPKGPSNYSPEFQDRYFRAQAARMNRLIDTAKDKLGRMKDNAYPYPDDDIIVIPRGGNPGSGPGAAAALFIAMPSLEAVNATSKPARLLRNDGTHHDRDHQKRLRRQPAAGARQPALRHRHQDLHAALVPERKRHPRQTRDGRHRLLLDQQLDGLRGAVDHRAGDVHRDGRALFHPRQRAPLRPVRQQGQGLHHHRGCRARLHTVQTMRDDAGAIFQFGQEPVRLH